MAVKAPAPQGKGIVKALGKKGTTGNFKKIEAAKGKGAAIGALQNKLAKRRGEPVPYHGKSGGAPNVKQATANIKSRMSRKSKSKTSIGF